MKTNGSRFPIPFRAALAGLLLSAGCAGPTPEAPEVDPVSAILQRHMVVDPRGHDAIFPLSRGAGDPLRSGGSAGGWDRRGRFGRRHRHRGALGGRPE